MIPPTIPKTMFKPQMKHIPGIHWVKLVFIAHKTKGHSQAHTGIISPYTSVAVSWRKFIIFYCFINIAKAILNQPIALFFERVKLSRRAQSIAYGHSQHYRDPSGFLSRQIELLRIEFFIVEVFEYLLEP